MALTCQQTSVINAIRAHLAELGIVAPVGRKGGYVYGAVLNAGALIVGSPLRLEANAPHGPPIAVSKSD